MMQKFCLITILIFETSLAEEFCQVLNFIFLGYGLGFKLLKSWKHFKCLGNACQMSGGFWIMVFVMHILEQALSGPEKLLPFSTIINCELYCYIRACSQTYIMYIYFVYVKTLSMYSHCQNVYNTWITVTRLESRCVRRSWHQNSHEFVVGGDICVAVLLYCISYAHYNMQDEWFWYLLIKIPSVHDTRFWTQVDAWKQILYTSHFHRHLNSSTWIF